MHPIIFLKNDASISSPSILILDNLSPTLFYQNRQTPSRMQCSRKFYVRFRFFCWFFISLIKTERPWKSFIRKWKIDIRSDLPLAKIKPGSYFWLYGQIMRQRIYRTRLWKVDDSGLYSGFPEYFDTVQTLFQALVFIASGRQLSVRAKQFKHIPVFFCSACFEKRNSRGRWFFIFNLSDLREDAGLWNAGFQPGTVCEAFWNKDLLLWRNAEDKIKAVHRIALDLKQCFGLWAIPLVFQSVLYHLHPPFTLCASIIVKAKKSFLQC